MAFQREIETIGRITVEIELANNVDIRMVERGALNGDQVRRLRIQGVVDTGATHMVVPPEVVEQLGLPMGADTVVRYADHRTATRHVAEDLRAELLGRQGSFKAIVEPSRSTVLIGAIVLEDLDLLVDCSRQTLAPRDPDHTIYEVE